jgi:hypothetical protein
MKKDQKPTKEGRLAEQALKKAVAAAIEEKRRLGLPVAIMKNGRAVLIKADKIKIKHAGTK